MSANMVYASTNEALNKILSVVAEAYTLPGADTDILDFIKDSIVSYIQDKAREAGQNAYQQATTDMNQGGRQMGMPTGGAPSAPGMNNGGSPMQIGPGGGGGMSGFGMPNPDELRRVLGATGSVS